MERVRLHGLGLRNFRGINSDSIRLAPFQAVNFFIGPNNAGKSTILQFISKYLYQETNVRQQWARKYDTIDVRLGANSHEVAYQLAVRHADLVDHFSKTSERGKSLLYRLLAEIQQDDLVWVQPDSQNSHLELSDANADSLDKKLLDEEWNILWRVLTNQSGGGKKDHWIPEVLRMIANACPPPQVPTKFIPAIRQISGSGAPFDDFSGTGLIDQLAEFQNPPHNERNKKQKFNKINSFLREVTGSPDAEIEVPFDRRHILVHMDKKVLPLSSLGTGIHEVIMLASFCTMVDDVIICMEEPEIHLHPVLQRKLIRYLESRTTNQYFIATHSPSLIDAVKASIFSVSNNISGTVISLSTTASQRFEVCKQLGYHASDLLQSNFVIWVEGPSDRIYLNHWISSLDPKLVEGIHYSIMFYGGRLLSHLAFNDPEVTEFISLRRLNRNLLVLIDSDKKSSGSRISDTKKRVLSELGDDHCWITKGREIENYVPAEIVEQCLQTMHKTQFGALASAEKYDHRLHFKATSGDLIKAVDKVKVAKHVATYPADLSQLDLRNRITRLIAQIQDANPAGS